MRIVLVLVARLLVLDCAAVVSRTKYEEEYEDGVAVVTPTRLTIASRIDAAIVGSEDSRACLETICRVGSWCAAFEAARCACHGV